MCHTPLANWELNAQSLVLNRFASTLAAHQYLWLVAPGMISPDPELWQCADAARQLYRRTPHTVATARLFGLGLEALYRAGRSYSPDGRYHAITPMLRQFLRRAGFGDLNCRGYAIDHSFGTQAHRGFCENYQLLFKLGRPFLLQQGLATQEELDALYEQALCEMLSEEFGALLYLLTVWGRKEQGMSTQAGE